MSSVNLDIPNGDVTFSVKDEGNGPLVEISSCYFGSISSKIEVHTTKEALAKLGEMFTNASRQFYSEEYCHAAELGSSEPADDIL